MKKSRCSKVAVLGMAMFMSASVWAVECNDVVWKDAVLSKYPTISEYCQGVVERDGRTFVQLDAKFISADDGRAKLQFEHPDGSYGDTFETDKLSDDFRVTLSGRPTRIEDIPRNSQLHVFMPPDRFELVGDLESSSTIASLSAYEEPGVLPDTGSNLPVILLMGLLSGLAGIVLTVRRKLFRS